MDQNKLIKRFVIGTFVSLYILVSLISTVHVIDFFALSNPRWMAITLAVGFELGAAASLASLVILDKMNKTMVWALFITITLMQMNGNLYYAFTNLEDFQSWSELFNLMEEEVLYQKRILAFVSGAILPLVALGFIKSLIDYIKPQDESEFTPEDSSFSSISEKDKNIQEPEPSIDNEKFKAKIEDMRGVDVYDSLQDDIENHVVEQPTKEEREQILADMIKRDEELGLYDDWDDTLLDGLEDEYTSDMHYETMTGNVESSDLDEDWDEEHAYDHVLNDIASDFTEKDVESMINSIVESEEPNEKLKTAADSYKNNPTSVGAVVENILDHTTDQAMDEDDLMELAKRRLAKERMINYLNEKRNGTESSDNS